MNPYKKKPGIKDCREKPKRIDSYSAGKESDGIRLLRKAKNEIERRS